MLDLLFLHFKYCNKTLYFCISMICMDTYLPHSSVKLSTELSKELNLLPHFLAK